MEVETDGGGGSAEVAFRELKPYLVGHEPFELEALRFKICNPTSSLYSNRTQLHAAPEFACLDLMDKFLNHPLHRLFGGKLRDQVPFASYLFWRLSDVKGTGEVRTIEQLIEHAQELKTRYGFYSHKFKGGVFQPEYELEAYRALVEVFPEDSLLYDHECGFGCVGITLVC